MRIVREATQPVAAWKNGGGTTREIARAPAGSSLDTFDWRISRAHVAVDGPFSRFEGVDRTLTVLSGDGIRLSVDGEAITLGRGSEPFGFSGESRVEAWLVRDPIDDLNVMTRRSVYRHRVRRLTESELRGAGDVLVVFVIRGTLTLDSGEVLRAGDALQCDADETAVIRANEADALVVDLFRVR